MKRFFIRHWFNILTLLIAIVALVISLRGNEIALISSTSKLEVISNYGSYGIITVSGCYNDYNSEAPFQVNRHAGEVLTFVNRGGRTASLIKASFSEGKGQYGDAKFSEWDPGNFSGSRDLKLSLDIEAGTGKIWFVQTTNISAWNTVKDALNAINYPDPQATILPEIPKPAIWKFEFSDGSTIIHEYKAGAYHIQPSIDSRMKDSKCD